MTRRRIAAALAIAAFVAGAAIYIAAGGSPSRAPQALGQVGNPHRVFGAHGSGEIKILTPVNTALPSISGTTTEGELLTASTGTWERVASYSYAWERCNTSGESCSAISEATSAIYGAVGADVGHQLRVIVTGYNAAGNTQVTSAATATIKAKEGVSAGCFAKIVEHEEECGGDPSAAQTGVEAGVTLTKHPGSMLVTKEGETLKALKIEGSLEIKANNVTVENVEVVTTELKKVCEKIEGAKAEGSGALQLQSHGTPAGPSTGVLIKHVTVRGVTQGCPEPLGEGINIKDGGSAADATIEWTRVELVGKCYHQAAILEHDFCDTNAALPAIAGTAYSGAHYDGLFANGEGTTKANPGLVVRHDTFLMPHWQTSPLFLPNEHEWGEARIEDNLVAGGGYLLYAPSGTMASTAGPVYFTDNRWARCIAAKQVVVNSHHLCEGLSAENETTEVPVTPDTHGYFPLGGSYGVLFSRNEEKDHFSGNFWDDNLEAWSP